MSAILKICQIMYMNDVSLPMLKGFEVKNTYTIYDLFTIPENVQPKTALLYLESLGLILIF